MTELSSSWCLVSSLKRNSFRFFLFSSSDAWLLPLLILFSATRSSSSARYLASGCAKQLIFAQLTERGCSSDVCGPPSGLCNLFPFKLFHDFRRLFKSFFSSCCVRHFCTEVPWWRVRLPSQRLSIVFLLTNLASAIFLRNPGYKGRAGEAIFSYAM